MSPEEIIYVREAFGFTQQSFAKVLGVSSASVARWESGQEPKGTAAAVLRGLYGAAWLVRTMPAERERMTATLNLGLAGVIYLGLVGSQPQLSPSRK